MNWAHFAIEALRRGESCQIRPRGNSMRPKVKSGALVTLDPITDRTELADGDIVLVSMGRTTYLHLISAVQGDRYQISNNKGHVNGWVSRDAIHGRAVSIDNTGC